MSDSLSIPSFKFLLLHIKHNEKGNKLIDYNHLSGSIKGKKKREKKLNILIRKRHKKKKKKKQRERIIGYSDLIKRKSEPKIHYCNL